jgi:hypothetical protein
MILDILAALFIWYLFWNVLIPLLDNFLVWFMEYWRGE